MARSADKLKSMAIVGVFAALCYLALLPIFRIPIPAPVGDPFLHVGNLLVILCALLYGGVGGGLAGSIGMGLSDMTTGYLYTSPKTIVLKFFIGLIAGASFRALSKRKEKPVAGLLIFAGASVLLSVFLFVFFSTPSAQSAFVPALRVGLLIFAGFLVVLAALSRKLSVATFSVVMASGLAVLFNLAGEFIFGAAYKMLEGSAFVPALITSAASLPATLFNGIFSIVGAALLYFPLKKALQSAHLLNA
ncbi:ECF transporter S component [Solibaculum mannosilyticum]|uniref:ECF transporter S component n=1 Tax=Solibaculum mannosilyticum TaxID=2780922 RepID=UPI0034AE6829